MRDVHHPNFNLHALSEFRFILKWVFLAHFMLSCRTSREKIVYMWTENIFSNLHQLPCLIHRHSDMAILVQPFCWHLLPRGIIRFNRPWTIFSLTHTNVHFGYKGLLIDQCQSVLFVGLLFLLLKINFNEHKIINQAFTNLHVRYKGTWTFQTYYNDIFCTVSL